MEHGYFFFRFMPFNQDILQTGCREALRVLQPFPKWPRPLVTAGKL